VLIRRRQTADYQIARHGWYPGYPDITGFLALVQCNSDANDNKSCNKKADDLIEQGKATSDPVKRKALMTQATRLEMDDYPMIPLLQYSVARLVKPWIGGYDDANDQDEYRSKDLYVIKH
jgi:oligopeptide transport system substrate-binding protein